MKCSSCNADNAPNAVNCEYCGEILGAKSRTTAVSAAANAPLGTSSLSPDDFAPRKQEPDLLQPTQPSPKIAPINDDEAWKIFVGKNYEYFLRKWEVAGQKKSKQSWNWAAFLLGFSWMAYRKMYLYSWIFIGVVIVETLCEYAFGFPDKLSNAINFGIAATFGWQGNSWYKLHVEKKVKEITSMYAPEVAKIELARQGGTSIGAAIGFVVALLTIFFLVAFVAER